MPVQPTYPGVYVEEIPSGVRTITGVATSIAAFIGFFRRGPMNRAVQIFNIGDFEREFGGLDSRSEASYAIQQFFLNGGTQAYVVRVAGGNLVAANVTISSSVPAAGAAIQINAIYPGEWGNNIRIKIDHDTPVQDEFNMTVTEYDVSGSPLRQEVFLNLSMNNELPNYASTVINDDNAGSSLIRVDSTAGETPPAANGILSGEHTNVAEVSITTANPTLNILINEEASEVPVVLQDTPPGEYNLRNLALRLENAIRSVNPVNPLLTGATVNVVQNRLHILAGRGAPQDVVSFAAHNDDATSFGELALGTGTANLQEYILGRGAFEDTAQMDRQGASDPPEEGSDGLAPDGAALIGAQNNKTGLYALEDVDLFNILCIPRTSMVSDSDPSMMTPEQAGAVIARAEAYCQEKRAFFIMDTPWGIDDLQGIKNWMAENGHLRNRNAALYYPRTSIPDPLNKFRLRSVGASGAIAGLYARTDVSRGVWKAPAGTETRLSNVPELTDVLSDQENGVLNPLGINSLRNFPVYGNISWGARTLEGADQMASEWKYIPVRRTALFIEESLYRGLKWVVFEPNDEPLWAQIRLNVGAFMHNLFRQGAFQGKKNEAYFVKCDAETTTQNDIDRGMVNILMGFAPLKPAEFVIIKLQQIAGQIQT